MKEFLEDARAVVIELQRGLIEKLRDEVAALKRQLHGDGEKP